MMDESEQLMYDTLRKEVDAVRMDEKALIETIGALQAENEALWKLIEAMRKRMEHLR